MATTQPTRIPGNLVVAGSVRADSIILPPGSVTASSVEEGAGLPASGLQHQHPLTYRQDGTVAAATVPIHIARGAGEVVGIKATVLTPATGADRAITIDLQAGAQGVAFATLLTGVITIDETAVAAQVFEGTLIVDPSYVDDETLQLVITVAGAAGAQAAGLLVEVTTREDADA